MTYRAPDGKVYASRYRYSVRGQTPLHVFNCQECDAPLDDPAAGRYRRRDCEYCDDRCRARARRKAAKS